MSQEIRSITQIGKTEPFHLQVARGDVTAHVGKTLFGKSGAVGASGFVTLWEQTTAFQFLTTASVLTLKSSNNADTDVVVLIKGLNDEYERIEESVNISGTTGVDTQLSFFRINELIITSGTAQGNITAGVSTTVYSQITAGNKRSLTTVFTVPKNHSFYVYQINVSSINIDANTTTTTFRNLLTYSDGSSEIIEEMTFFDQINLNNSIPLKVPEKARIELQFKTNENTSAVDAFAKGILLQENGPL